MTIPIFQVDAFASQLFGGNPAAVCPLDHWISDELMQNIATENNLSETAFYVKNGDHFDLRWFTPVAEVDLCGHATLATAHVIFTQQYFNENEIKFETRSGTLIVSKTDKGYSMNFPTYEIEAIDTPSLIIDAIQQTPIATFIGKEDYLVILDSQKQIEELNPNMQAVKALGKRGLIVSAKGDKVDFVSRCFFPNYGIDEDPVTGSAHTTLTPYWTKQLDKKEMTAIQLSKRRGHLICIFNGDRVELLGEAKTYLVGEIKV